MTERWEGKSSAKALGGKQLGVFQEEKQPARETKQCCRRRQGPIKSRTALTDTHMNQFVFRVPCCGIRLERPSAGKDKYEGRHRKESRVWLHNPVNGGDMDPWGRRREMNLVVGTKERQSRVLLDMLYQRPIRHCCREI